MLLATGTARTTQTPHQTPHRRTSTAASTFPGIGVAGCICAAAVHPRQRGLELSPGRQRMVVKIRIHTINVTPHPRRQLQRLCAHYLAYELATFFAEAEAEALANG